MFGYVTTNMEEMKIKEYRTYHGFYCGICQDLKEFHGQSSRITLTYDMTFLAVLLSGLYEEQTEKEFCRCGMHPLKKHLACRNSCTAYAADMNVLLSYYNLLDDWQDEKKITALALARTMKKDIRRLQKKYPRQCKAIGQYLKKLKDCEREKSPDLDRASGDTGELMREIFIWKQDGWAETVGEIGYFLGKFIYLMDAFDDMKKDEKNGNYNPWSFFAKEKDFSKRAEEILTMLLANCCKQFEKLPIVEYIDILRNILYSGVWTKYDFITKKNKEKQ